MAVVPEEAINLCQSLMDKGCYFYSLCSKSSSVFGFLHLSFPQILFFFSFFFSCSWGTTEKNISGDHFYSFARSVFYIQISHLFLLKGCVYCIWFVNCSLELDSASLLLNLIMFVNSCYIILMHLYALYIERGFKFVLGMHLWLFNSCNISNVILAQTSLERVIDTTCL